MLLEKTDNQRKEAGIGPSLKRRDLFKFMLLKTLVMSMTLNTAHKMVLFGVSFSGKIPHPVSSQIMWQGNFYAPNILSQHLQRFTMGENLFKSLKNLPLQQTAILFCLIHAHAFLTPKMVREYDTGKFYSKLQK